MARVCEDVYRHQHFPTPFASLPAESRPGTLLSSRSHTSSCPSGMPWRPLAVEGRGLDEESWAEETREESYEKEGEWQAELDSSSAWLCVADVAVVLVEMVVCHPSNLLAATHCPRRPLHRKFVVSCRRSTKRHVAGRAIVGASSPRDKSRNGQCLRRRRATSRGQAAVRILKRQAQKALPCCPLPSQPLPSYTRKVRACEGAGRWL